MDNFFLLNKFKKFVMGYYFFKRNLLDNRINVGGYTILEMLISMTIVFILSGILLTYNHKTEEQITLFKDQAVLVGAINRAKALSQQRLNINDVCAFGIYILSSNEFLIFGDRKIDSSLSCIDNNGNYTTNLTYDDGEESILYPSGNIKKEIFLLDKSLKFSTNIGKDIVFIPPDMFVTSTMSLPATIKIENNDNSKFVITKIYSGGQVVISGVNKNTLPISKKY